MKDDAVQKRDVEGNICKSYTRVKRNCIQKYVTEQEKDACL